MGQVLHGTAKTTNAARAELQPSQASVAHLAKKYGVNENGFEVAQAAIGRRHVDGAEGAA